MKLFLQGFAWLFDLVMWPFKGLPPAVSMIVLSAITGVMMLLIFKYTSNQRQIKKVKRLIKGHFLAISIYKESLKVLLGSTVKILWLNLKYVRYNMVPLLFAVVPFLLLAVNIDAWFGHRAIDPGTNFVLNVDVDEEVDLFDGKVTLKVPEGLQLETAPLRNSEDQQVSWRIGAKTPGTYTLVIEIDGETTEKEVIVGPTFDRLSPKRYRTGFLNKALYPTESILPESGPITAVSLSYPDTELDLFGLSMHWIYAYIILSMLVAFPLKGVFNVDF